MLLALPCPAAPAAQLPTPVAASSPSPAPLVLTLPQSLEIGYRQSPVLAEARQNVVQAVAQYQQAQSQKNLTLGFQSQSQFQAPRSLNLSLGRQSFNARVVDFMSNTISLGFKNLLTTFGRVENQVAAAFVQIDVQVVGVEITRQSLELDIKQSFFERLKADGNVSVARENLGVSQAALEDTRKLFRQGIKARYDVLQAELQVYEAIEQLQQALNQVESTTATFYTVLNQDPRPPLTLVAPPPIEVAADVTLLALQETGLLNRPEIEQLDRSLAAARLLIRAAQAQSNPTVSLGLNYNTSTGSLLAVNDQVVAGLGFSWPLWDGGLRNAMVAEARSQLVQLEASGVDLRQQVRLQVEQAWLAFQLSDFTLATARKRVATAVEYVSMTQARFNNGLATALELQQSLSQLNTARRDEVVAEADRNEAFARLERAMGLDVPDRRLSLAALKSGKTTEIRGAHDAD